MTDFDDTECPLRGAIYESRVAHLISKFCGYLYFLPYRDSHVHENLACRPYRSAPVNFCLLLKSQTDARKLLLILNVTAAFISQDKIKNFTTDSLSMILEKSSLLSKTLLFCNYFHLFTRPNPLKRTLSMHICSNSASSKAGVTIFRIRALARTCLPRQFDTTQVWSLKVSCNTEGALYSVSCFSTSDKSLPGERC